MTKLIAISFIVLGFTQVSKALESFTEAFPIQQVLTASDSDGQLRLLHQVIYPNGCYQPENNIISLDAEDQRIYLSHQVDVKKAECTQALVEEIAEVEMPLPPLGVYDVQDILTGRDLGDLYVEDDGVHYVPPTAPSRH